MIIGLWEMGYAVAKWFTAHDFNGLMTDVLHGLDFVLLSPLVYLSATGVILYVKAELEQKDVEESFGRLHRTKFLIGTLFLAITATTMMERLVAGSPISYEQVATAGLLAAGSLGLLVVLGRTMTRR